MYFPVVVPDIEYLDDVASNHHALDLDLLQVLPVDKRLKHADSSRNRRLREITTQQRRQRKMLKLRTLIIKIRKKESCPAPAPPPSRSGYPPKG